MCLSGSQVEGGQEEYHVGAISSQMMVAWAQQLHRWKQREVQLGRVEGGADTVGMS